MSSMHSRKNIPNNQARGHSVTVCIKCNNPSICTLRVIMIVIDREINHMLIAFS